MARIRTVKPDFFEDEDIGLLSQAARLLFIGSWTLADDEGLLRWTAPYMKASVFMYDSVDVDQVETFMDELVDAGMVYAYKGGKSQQRLGWIVNFRRHQRINRPQEGKLPPPSLQNRDVVRTYAARDRWRCAICGETVLEDAAQRAGVLKAAPSLDHIEPKSHGGSDFPTNIRLVHQGCNASRGNRPVSDSVNDSVNDSVTEGKGKERKGREGKGRESDVVPTPDAPLSELLADLVAGNDPNGKRPNVTKTWATEEDRMVRLDERNPVEAERLIRWVQNDSFWRGNVLSMPTFREKYGQLYQAAVKDTEKRKAPGVSQAERFAAKARQLEAEEQAA